MLVFSQNSPPKRNFWGAIAGFETQTLDWLAEVEFVRTERREPGLQVGGFWGHHFSKSVVLRAEAQVSLTANRLYYEAEDSPYFNVLHQFADLEFPLHLVFTNPKGHFPLRGSLFAGGRVGFNVLKNKDLRGMNFSPFRAGLDLGLGVEINLGRFRLQPELVYSFGLNNANDAALTPEIWQLGRTVRDKMALRLLFFKV